MDVSSMSASREERERERERELINRVAFSILIWSIAFGGHGNGYSDHLRFIT